jgi:hypothetical protein
VNPSLDSVTFDAAEFVFVGDSEGVRMWHTHAGDAVDLHFFLQPPDVPAAIDRLDDLRKAYRDMLARAGVGLIELDVIETDGCRAVSLIVKVPQQPTGMTYIGSLTLPFRDFSYVLKVQCAERGMTGLRDAMVADQARASGRIKWVSDPISATGAQRIEGWSQDPYDPTFRAPLMSNLSDDAQYDAQFPDHPLSRLRPVLRHLVSTVSIAEEVKVAVPFVFSLGNRAKPWWKLW